MYGHTTYIIIEYGEIFLRYIDSNMDIMHILVNITGLLITNINGICDSGWPINERYK